MDLSDPGPTVLIPCYKRPHRVKPTLDSFLASDAGARIVFIVQLDQADEYLAVTSDLKGAQVLLVDSECVSWPQKINRAYRELDLASDPRLWFLAGADDIRFWPRWWQITAKARANEAIGVIGTQDMGNPIVMRGQHTTHPLIRSGYVKDRGASLDGPGVVIHEGYRHWYCDNELVELAKSRNAWEFVNGAVIEHLHPYWKKGHWDEVYDIGQNAADTDKLLWDERAARILTEAQPSA